MADESKIGTHWQDDELDAIVADYFAMLEDDLSGRPYVKSRHSQALMAQIGRTHSSDLFKHQNISAVLDELGMPWIPGYMPKRNYQNAIFDAIDRYLTRHPAILERAGRLGFQRRSVTQPVLHDQHSEPLAEYARPNVATGADMLRHQRTGSIGARNDLGAGIKDPCRSTPRLPPRFCHSTIQVNHL